MQGAFKYVDAEKYSPKGEFEFKSTEGLIYGEVSLNYTQKRMGDPAKAYVPDYLFDIMVDGVRVGALSFRIGYTPNLYVGGHIGYNVDEPYRGHAYAAKACKALMPLILRHGFTHVLISNDATNTASRRTCENIGATLVEIIDTPQWCELYDDGQRRTSVYEWAVQE